MNVVSRIVHRDVFRFIFLSLLILTATSATTYTASELGQTYAVAVVRVVRWSLSGDLTLYATIKLQFPEYIVVDRGTKIYAYFDRTSCFVGVDIIHFTVAAKINTVSGSAEYELVSGSFVINCDAPASQTKEFELVVPKAVYDLSIDKTITLYVKSIDASPTQYVKEVTIVTNTPARSYLVYGVPQPVVSVRGVDAGYLNLSVGESRDVTILFTSMYAPATVVNVNATLPDFVSLYVNTPLPLNVGANQTMPIVVTIRGERPGAGVAAVHIYYYTGAEVKHVSVYIPVICEESRIYELINMYRQELERLRQEIQSLENQLGISIDAAQNLTQQLNTISQELNVLMASLNSLVLQYASALQKMDGLEGRVNSLAQQLSAVSQKLDDLTASLNSLSPACFRRSEG